MRCHVVTSKELTQFAASQAEGVQIRIDMMEKFGVKRKDVSVEPVDIPTNKAELLAWLNVRELSR